MMTDLTEMLIAQEESLVTFYTLMSAVLFPADLDSSVMSSRSVHVKREIKICFADTPGRLHQAGSLVDRMYEWRGYRHENIIRNSPFAVTLLACGQEENPIGTVTIGFDSPEEGLLADGNYRNEVDALRDRGRKVCEFNGFAMEPEIRSKRVLAALFHSSMIYAWKLYGYTDGLIEVTPAHARFYERSLGFSQLGEERVCPRVNTSGVLMHVDFARVEERIDEVGGRMEKTKGGPTLFPYFFGKTDVKLIIDRIRNRAIPPVLI